MNQDSIQATHAQAPVVEKPLVGLQEIADYLQKSERTIRRYRRLRGFPIYRKRGTGALFAFPSELNRWIRER